MDQIRNTTNQMANIVCCMFFPFLEIEAKEACDWLRAAGFPQYAQLYEGKTACYEQKKKEKKEIIKIACCFFI